MTCRSVKQTITYSCAPTTLANDTVFADFVCQTQWKRASYDDIHIERSHA